jgi:hypothetical protein
MQTRCDRPLARRPSVAYALRELEGVELGFVLGCCKMKQGSRYVRATILCSDLPVNDETASVERIEETARNPTGNGQDEIAGYDTATVRMILLDESVRSPYPAEAPKEYAGR